MSIFVLYQTLSAELFKVTKDAYNMLKSKQ